MNVYLIVKVLDKIDYAFYQISSAFY